MTLVDLLPPYTTGLGWRPASMAAPIALKRGPRYVRTRNGSRWHRPRSGVYYPAYVSELLGPQPARTSWSLFCGPHMSDVDKQTRLPVLRAEYPPDADPSCGTCEGRAAGVNSEIPELLFTPHGIRPPRYCPSGASASYGRRDLYEEIPDPRGWPRNGRCLACGAIEPIRAKGGIYRSYVALAQHEPLDLIPGCPFHAWRQLIKWNGEAVCACTVPERRFG